MLGNEATMLRQETGSDYSGDGYDWPEAHRAIAGWGAHGWDMGDWPYVMVVAGRNEAGEFYTLVRVEGDLTWRFFATKEDRNRDLDLHAEYYWRRRPGDHGDGMVRAVAEYEFGKLPDHFYGPRGKDRCPDYATCEWREDQSEAKGPVVRVRSAAHLGEELR